MLVMDTQGNWIDEINANTGMDVSNDGIAIQGDSAIPFDHASRLADKLFGAVGVALDNVTSGIQIQNLKNQSTYQQMQGQSVIVKIPVSRWIKNNILLLIILIFSLMIFGAFKR